jgi:DNA-binding MarR family transcriptional regulator
LVKNMAVPADIEQSMLSASKIMVNILAESLINQGLEDITVPKFRILDMVYNGISNPVEIARMLDVSPPAISGMLEILESGGFLKRVIDASDRRKIEVSLSAKGLSAVEKVNDYRVAYLKRVLRSMGSNQAEQLKESLEAFNNGYAEMKSKKVEALAGRDINRMESKKHS